MSNEVLVLTDRGMTAPANQVETHVSAAACLRSLTGYSACVAEALHQTPLRFSLVKPSAKQLKVKRAS